MKRPSKLNRTWLMAGAAVVIIAAGGVWFTVSRAPSPAAVPAEGDHAEEEAGAPEGTLALSDAQISAAGIGVVSIMGGGGGETLLSGRVEPMIDARAAVSAVVGGRVERVLVAPGQSVRAGQALAVLVSGDAASLRADADAAQANAVAAQQAHAREESLADQGVVARRDAEVAHAQALGAEAAARAARARASAAGAPNASGRVNVSSPIAGVVTSVLVGPAGFAAQGGVIAEVTNPAWVEIVFNAPPALAVQVRSGSTMRVQGPAGEFEAQVTGVAAGRTEILSGLTASDRVAGSNAFLLKAELAKGEAEHGH